jgi:hypothetical protein
MAHFVEEEVSLEVVVKVDCLALMVSKGGPISLIPLIYIILPVVLL